MSLENDVTGIDAQDDLLPDQILDQVVAIASDDFVLVDAAAGLIFEGRLGLRQWLQSGVGEVISERIPIELRFAEIVQLRNGQISRMRAFPDMATVLDELGLPVRSVGDSI